MGGLKLQINIICYIKNLFEIKRAIPCHKDIQRLINSDYIYRICYRNAKKANSPKWICPYWKKISTI